MKQMRGLWWWIDRWRKSTAYTDMTLEEQGAYRNLLDEAHLRGGALPDSERVLSRACGDSAVWDRVRLAVMSHFELRADGWHHPTLDEVIRQSRRRAQNQHNYRSRRSHSADNGADNEPANASDNDNNPDNKPASPDQDQDPDPDPGLQRAYRRVGGVPLTRRRNLNAAFEGARVDVPQQLHAEFVRLRNHADAEKELLLWYEAVSEEWAVGKHRDTPTGGSMFTFWRDRFSEKWPPVKTAAARRPAWAVEGS